jgi:hypothetical protein
MSAIVHMPHQSTFGGGALTIDECVDNVLPVLLNQVVDVTEDTAVGMLSVSQLSTASQLHRAGQLDLPHGEKTKVLCWI